jgi:hypothetical protein
MGPISILKPCSCRLVKLRAINLEENISVSIELLETLLARLIISHRLLELRDDGAICVVGQIQKNERQTQQWLQQQNNTQQSHTQITQ